MEKEDSGQCKSRQSWVFSSFHEEDLVVPVQFLFSKASLAPGQLPPRDLSRFVISHSSSITGKIDRGVVSN